MLGTAVVLIHTELIVWQEEQTVLKAGTKLGRDAVKRRQA